MSSLTDFIGQAAGSLGVSSDDATKATSGLLGMIQKEATDDDASSLMSALPGAMDLLSGSGGKSGGGMMGNLMGAAGGLLGGKAGGALSLLGVFKDANMDTGQAASFAGMFVDYLTKNAGGDLVGRILGQVPELKKMLNK